MRRRNMVDRAIYLYLLYRKIRKKDGDDSFATYFTLQFENIEK